jgi:DNA mismatch endonuclease (patch repair protein)
MMGILRDAGIKGWRRGSRMFGKPDFVFSKHKVVVFVDGCFWHRCRRPGHWKPPGNNAKVWRQKLQKNVLRDRAVNRQLRKDGWTVVRFWEHELRNPTACVGRLKKTLGDCLLIGFGEEK